MRSGSQGDQAQCQRQRRPKALTENEDVIVAELAEAQGKPVDIGGYYAPDSDMTTAVMGPSKTFNAALAAAKG